MTFTKIHLAITEEELKPVQDNFSSDLNLKSIKPDQNFFQLLTRGVGGKYGWHLRREYHDDASYDEIMDKIEAPGSRFWLFRHKKEIVGFCCAAVVEPELTDRFNFVVQEKPQKVMEIYKVGLFDEHTGHGWGRFFIPSVMRELFKEYDVIYLNTRDTNHEKVVPFYESLGMRILSKETLEDDIIPANIEDRFSVQSLQQ